jgi:hypothetical protein
VQRFIVISIITTLAYITSTRIPESDLVFYINTFQGAKDISFFEFIFFQAKDPFFNLITFVLANLDLESYQYVFTLSFLFYFLIFKIVETFNITYDIKMMLFLSLCFNPIIFSLHIHLLRQFIGLVFFIYSITLINKKYKTLFKLMAVLSHFSFIVILAFMRLVSNLRNLLIVVLLIILIFLYKDNLVSVPILGYLIARSSGQYLDFDTPSIGSLAFGFLMSIFIFYNLSYENKLLNKEFKIFIWAVLSMFLVSFFFSSELFYRTFPIIVIISHFIFLEFSEKIKFPESLNFKPMVIWFPINIILFILFLKSLFIGQWKYSLFV